jgi:protein-glutamine gamma-glutamyltransferase
MTLERPVQIQIGMLAMVGAMMLGLGSGDATLPLLVLFAAITSLVFTDVLNWLCLNRIVANVAAVLALFSCLADFIQQDIPGKLLAVANLLVYLQVILFYQRKHDRLYWQLIVLSLLQVVVSAALNVPVGFGILLLVYAALAISTLTFFFLHREVMRVTELGRRRRPGEAASRVVHQATPIWHCLLESTPHVTSAVNGRRITTRLTERGLISQIVAMGVTTLVLSLVLFYSFPRLGVGGGRAMVSRSVSLVGFSSELSLGRLNDVLQSDELVMRISLRHAESGEAIRVMGDPYIRGAVLTDYVAHGQEVAWQQRRDFTRGFLRPSMTGPPPGLLRPPPGRTLVRQDVILEPMREPVLFAIFPAFRTDETSDDLRLDPITKRLESQEMLQANTRREYRYRLATTALRGGTQVAVTPHVFRQRDPSYDEYLKIELNQLRVFDARRFPRLKMIADQIAQQSRSLGGSRADVARALREHFLRVENDYAYTLQLSQIERDPSLDPIEDFVVNHRTGHCEYYASALVMMLRSQGIPARLIVGFRSDEYNTIGGYYQVRQRHAHVWVEAYLELDEVVAELPPDSDIGPYGGWLRLDPTPGIERAWNSTTNRTMGNVIDEFLDYAQVLWSDYVLGLTAKRQQESIYAPVSEKADPDALSETWTQFAQQLQRLANAAARFLIGPQMRLMLILVLLISSIWFMAYFRRLNVPPGTRPVSRWKMLVTGQQPRQGLEVPATQPVLFYRRFERLLAKLGLVRPAGQTQREFAASAERHLKALPHTGDADVRVPALVVGAFYRVKFGAEVLPATEETTIDDGLKRLEQHALRRETQVASPDSSATNRAKIEATDSGPPEPP